MKVLQKKLGREQQKARVLFRRNPNFSLPFWGSHSGSRKTFFLDLSCPATPAAAAAGVRQGRVALVRSCWPRAVLHTSSVISARAPGRP